MIADTTFLSHLIKERRENKPGPATRFFHTHRAEPIRTTIISAGEVALLFHQSWEAFSWLHRWQIYRLHSGIAQAAADVEL